MEEGFEGEAINMPACHTLRRYSVRREPARGSGNGKEAKVDGCSDDGSAGSGDNRGVGVALKTESNRAEIDK